MRLGHADHLITQIVAGTADGRHLRVLVKRLSISRSRARISYSSLVGSSKLSAGKRVHALHKRAEVAFDDEVGSFSMKSRTGGGTPRAIGHG